MGNWTIADSEKTYGINDWGMKHFSVSSKGRLRVHPMADERCIDIMDIVKEAKSMGLTAPLTIRIQDLLRSRVKRLNNAFEKAIKDERYDGKYRGVFPIKTNQLREVVEEILDAGQEYQYGIEAGSKSELMIAMAMQQSNKSLLVCNGYKDQNYMRLAFNASKIGKNVFIVIEQLSEIDTLLKLAKAEGFSPNIGLRVKLNVSGEGKWADSVGENAKFGLFPTEIISALGKLKRAGLRDKVKLVHFHVGSQVPNIATIKSAVNEATRFYCELRRMGFPVDYIDCGGGLAIDYDGSRSNYESSANYSLEEYASTVVYTIKSLCDQADAPHPTIVTESGRAIVAPHSILVLEVCDSIEKTPYDKPLVVKRSTKQVLKDLADILDKKSLRPKTSSGKSAATCPRAYAGRTRFPKTSRKSTRYCRPSTSATSPCSSRCSTTGPSSSSSPSCPSRASTKSQTCRPRLSTSPATPTAKSTSSSTLRTSATPCPCTSSGKTSLTTSAFSSSAHTRTS